MTDHRLTHHRAKVGAIARRVNTGERSPQELADARRDLAAAKIADYVERIIAEAPPLTDDQRNRISALLRTGSNSVATQQERVLPATQAAREARRRNKSRRSA